MDRKMRRFKQMLPQKETQDIIANATSGVLSLCGEDGMPYGVPLSHAFADGKLYFHTAITGHKVDLMKQNQNASFTVIEKDEIHPESYTTYFRSAIAFGKVKIIDDSAQKMHILQILGRRCNPDDEVSLNEEISRGFSHCLTLEMYIERMTGKQAIELTNPHQL